MFSSPLLTYKAKQTTAVSVSKNSVLCIVIVSMLRSIVCITELNDLVA